MRYLLRAWFKNEQSGSSAGLFFGVIIFEFFPISNKHQ